ncbi:ATP-dependent Clp protease ATP-binding subunit, partial [bacterium]|nr:ATP-dependent Clp protease ATP-binding subunit [bacterium]
MTYQDDTPPAYDLRGSRFFNILLLEDILSHKRRHSILLLVGFFWRIPLALSLLFFLLRALGKSAGISAVAGLAEEIFGVALIIFPFWLFFYLLEAYYRSICFSQLDLSLFLEKRRGTAPETAEEESGGEKIWLADSMDSITYEVAAVFYATSGSDVLASFTGSAFGGNVFLRCGLRPDQTEEFLSGRSAVSPFMPPTAANDLFTLRDLALALFDQYEELRDFLFKSGIQRDDFGEAAAWVMREQDMLKYRERWWGSDRLLRIPGFGAGLAFGKSFRIERYARDITTFGALARGFHSALGFSYHEKEVALLEDVLSRSDEANAILFGEEGVGTVSVVQEFARRIAEGESVSALNRKRVVILDTSLIVSAMKVKSEFELEFRRILVEAAKAGNMILVFDNFPALMESARAIGTDVVSIMDPYLSGSDMQIIALAEIGRFHQEIETDGAVMKRFEAIEIKEPDERTLVRILEDSAERIESGTGVFFTYPVFLEIVRSADSYFPLGIMPDKAVDFMVELAPQVAGKGERMVTREDVFEIIRMKTGVPVGEISGEEREKLTNLEALLHERVIGQKEAIEAIAEAMRRARSGVRNPKRPMGTFLFLGPTGVGKTETAKALAYTFFGNDERMIRLDMSEYQSDDALQRLIGSFESGKVGKLVSLLRENPYSVLLLDEFEKTNPVAKDLFLQVLDEGMFTDMYGKKVSARNAIIIATSNAGADIIYETARTGGSLVSKRDTIIDMIIKRGIYKPELLNRFDGVILFHPLRIEEVREIARLMIGKLAKRLENEGMKIELSDTLINMIAEEGLSAEFGARQLNRVLQDHVENIISKKIISGEAERGSTILLTEKDLQSAGTPSGGEKKYAVPLKPTPLPQKEMKPPGYPNVPLPPPSPLPPSPPVPPSPLPPIPPAVSPPKQEQEKIVSPP